VPSPVKALQINRDADAADESFEESERITLSDFLAMTNIRFMELNTTKRRATGHPGAEGGFMSFAGMTEDCEPSMENNIAAAVGVLPMLSMYQHSCHEMKAYIHSGRAEVRNLEAAALETQPPLFHEYAGAPVAEKAIMDTQFKNLKTNARLQSKSGWHAWRSQLLNDLKKGLVQTKQELGGDDKTLTLMENVLQETLPALESQQQALETEKSQLEARKQDIETGAIGELESARAQLLVQDSELSEKRALLQSLQNELNEKAASIEEAQSWKVETVAAIKEAERISEEFRGWSSKEVFDLKGTRYGQVVRTFR
jgi:kinetochore protein Spc7/SPC105